MGFWAAVPTIASLASGFLGKKKSGGDTMPAQSLIPGIQQDAGNAVSQYIQKYLSQYQPGKAYGGDFTAGMTGAENVGIEKLNQFLTDPGLGELFSSGEQQIMDTLGGRYANPNESPFIRSMINLSNMNLQDSIDASRRSAGSRGTYFTKSAIEGENRLRERANTGLDAVVGEFQNQERGRQFQAAPIAQMFDKYRKMDVPLAKIRASQDFGSLPRLIEQADFEARYNDFKRQQDELSKIPGQAQSLYNSSTSYTPSYTNPVVEQNSSLANILGMVSKLNLGALQGKGSIWDKLLGVVKG